MVYMPSCVLPLAGDVCGESCMGGDEVWVPTWTSQVEDFTRAGCPGVACLVVCYGWEGLSAPLQPWRGSPWG